MNPKAKNHGILPRWVDFLSQVLVVYSIITFTLESEPGLGKHEFFFYSEVVVTIIFGLEYFARLFMAENKIGYIKSFYGIVDFLATAPMILTFGLVDLRFARIIRLLRLLRLLKFVRYTESADRLLDAFRLIKGELTVLIFSILAITYVAAVGIHLFESQAQPDDFGSITQSMWWAVVTLTTVGYGDVTPVTMGGKIFTVVIIFMGLGIVAIPSGLFASALVKVRQMKEKEDLEKSQLSTSDAKDSVNPAPIDIAI